MKSLDVKWPLQASHSSKAGKTGTESAHSSITGMTKEQTVANRLYSKKPFLFETLFSLGKSVPGHLIRLYYG